MDSLVDKCFCKHDIDVLKGFGLTEPSKVNDVNAMHDTAEKLLMKVGGIKGKAIQQHDKEISDDADYAMNLLRVYQNVLKPKKGRNNKIGSCGEFGNLVIHLPCLLTYEQLKVFANGMKVMDEVVDQDTIDLLMKRLDKKRNYSKLSHEIFDKLIQLKDAANGEDYDAADDDDESEYENSDNMTPLFNAIMKEKDESDHNQEDNEVEQKKRTPYRSKVIEHLINRGRNHNRNQEDSFEVEQNNWTPYYRKLMDGDRNHNQEDYEVEPNKRAPYRSEVIEHLLNRGRNHNRNQEDSFEVEQNNWTPYYRKLIDSLIDDNYNQDYEKETGDMVKRLKILAKKIKEGDYSDDIRNEFSIIMHQLHNRGVVSEYQLDRLYDRYL